MERNNNHVSFETVNYRKRRRKRHTNRKRVFLVVITPIVILSVAIMCASTLVESSANGKGNRHPMPEVRTNQLEQITQTTQAPPVEEIGEEIPKEIVVEDEVRYDYSKPVPKSDMVDDKYFDGAVFIGDSRTEGLLLNTGLTNAMEYTHKGLMVDTIFTKPVINMNGDKVSVMDALRQTHFAKAYVMLGINETGWPYNDLFIEQYGKVIDEIKSINPDAAVYVQEILPVTQTVSANHSYVKNGKIEEFNGLICKMAEEKKVYYIDVGSAVVDAGGCLPEDAAVDGIHLNKSYCEKWMEYLKTHTVSEQKGGQKHGDVKKSSCIFDD